MKKSHLVSELHNLPRSPCLTCRMLNVRFGVKVWIFNNSTNCKFSANVADTATLRMIPPGNTMLPGRILGTWTVLAWLQHKMRKEDEKRQILYNLQYAARAVRRNLIDKLRNHYTVMKQCCIQYVWTSLDTVQLK